ncbi:Eukaryotic translation initiation factor 5B like protein [Argiope bruennichi]|uniref:Eukaryotic translation initiation factor 5B n=1 Tax=Argiope bruennichi TaxID=94029 RepID=A0A8T0FVB4_ARGBR|nr:Eukaryotic translation initiation factor 5B like protein [Argiope bruennichi]
MGKNRKVKQVVNQTNVESEDHATTDPNAPVEFLTSDDFQVVQKKRHHSKKSPDDHEERDFVPRSRTSSSRFTDAKDAIGCHSGFWGVKSQEYASEDNCRTDDIAKNFTSCKENEHGGGDYLPEICNGLQQLCMNGGAVEKGRETNDENSESVFNFEWPHPEDSFKTAEKETNSCDLNQNVLSKENEFSETLKCEEKDLSLSLKIDEIASVDANAPENSSLGNEDVNASEISRVECHTEKNSIKKKKEKKARDKQKSDSTSMSQKAAKVLTNSSSSDFSEVHAASNDEHELKEKDSEKKDRKRPSKKQLAAIHDALMKAKEEEERRKQEDEIQRKLAEEAEKQALERQRLEQEKKEKKKLKEKQKRERLKAEGRLLSKSQKQSRARLAATLEAFRQQGVDVPQLGEKRPGGLSMDKTNRKRLDSSRSDSGIVSKSERHKSESLSSQESGKESLSDLPSSFDSKESWDINDFRATEGMTTESDAGHFSCSEESDAIDEDHHAAMHALLKSKDISATGFKDSFEKSNLVKPKSDTHIISTSEEKENSVKLRSPVICVLGHVDTGKTKILDFIRKTHVQDSEAGGITQQIGATMIPQDALKEKCKMVKNFASFQLKVPGLLVIDTPGHESFRNLRSRGTSVCDMAILVVDIMHGLEPQTLESINLLKNSKIPFVVALNKIDRIYGWKSGKDEDIENVINKQNITTLLEFKKRCQDTVLQFAQQCLNAALFYENPDPRTFVSMIPTSAITGDGMGNLLSLITQLTQSFMRKRLTFSQELQATVLEVKAISGLGTTIDVILVNGHLQEGDTIVLVGHEGPIVTQIRSLLMPRPLKELRVKNPYLEYKTVEGAQGVKLIGKDLDKTIAGMPLFVAKNQSEIEHLKSEVAELLNQTVNNIKTSERGVYVLASTLGSLEALLDYLASASIPYVGVKVGPVVKRDVMKASIMLEHDKLYATILAFDVKIDRDAQELADSLGVKIFSANIIYHLFDMFVKYREEFDKKRDEARHQAVFPCILKVLSGDAGESDCPLILDVLVEAGSLRQYTPLCVSTKSNLELGSVSVIEIDGDYVACAKEGQQARITVEAKDGDLPKVYGTHFDNEDYLISRVTRQSIEVCKEYYRDELDETDWHLMSELKKMLHLHA